MDRYGLSMSQTAMMTADTSERIDCSDVGLHQTTGDDSLVVSVVIPCWNSSRFIRDCLTSVMRQTLRQIEIIVVDDASDDDSREVVEALAAIDDRILLLCSGRRGGPGQARNRALDVSRGKWIAVVDSDDLLHPDRLSTLVCEAEASGVDLIADNQILFRDDTNGIACPLLTGNLALHPTRISCVDYVRSNVLHGSHAALGYLKPLMRRSFVEQHRVRYNIKLSIAEDYDFVFRLLLAGANFRISPSLTYFYRRHASSTSFRLSHDALICMLDADAESSRSLQRRLTPELEQALRARRYSIHKAVAFTELVDSLKCHAWWNVVRAIVLRPRAALLLVGVIKDRLRRMSGGPTERAPAGKVACILSRQRVTGATNGSSAYLIGICKALRQDGWEVDLVCPSPAMFGRWPFFQLQPEMDLFRSISVRGAFRLGSFVVATNPAIAGRALLAVADRLLRRVGLHLGSLVRKAPHAIAVACADADKIFVASHAGRPSLVVADYAFLSETIPYVMSPLARTAIVMHDLFSAQKTKDRPVVIDLDHEMRLLASADVVVAIQREEANVVAAQIGLDRVIVVPMTVEIAADAQPGDGRTVMFVGSNTLPNADALEWLLAEIWPLVSGQIPSARLVVVGSVCQSISSPRRGVHLMGLVNSLAELYHSAAVVVSPLRSGSGLKVKLVEALASGKVMVGTSVTFQGVEHLAGTAALCADDATAFAEAIVASLRDEAERKRLGKCALEAAAREFCPGQSQAEFLSFANHGQGSRD